ncbi:PD-(D/E)XK nuclease superfamily protein [Candidatus Desulfarcum epimagneticum]|uniref:PD-(D/E)XK nuclease superfamily protein n=1 Tax=uncultured Desulfobacteraceae bacterium TaxID=218296 RepID=A0A484HBQ0_9BACT|nr:PD-(D/E)XK nuclease superfamily protein [uncultured Desulfobacteraceae bacterium]
MKRLPVGISDFKKVMEESRYFADKSLLIKEILNEDAEIVLLPRPRRFGKTLNLSMLRYFFETTDDRAQTRKLFQGLKIEKEEEFKAHAGRYPVIYLTLKDIKAPAFEKSLKHIKRLISNEFQRHDYLLESDFLSDLQKQNFNRVLTLKAQEELFEASLYDLSVYLHRHHSQKPVILIDEYDTPLHAAYVEGYYKEIISFFRTFFGAGLKDNGHIFKGVLTGILRIARESIFSGMNNLGVYSVISRKFSDKFGLTEEEVLDLFKYYQQEDKIPVAHEWYNGYMFDQSVIYNPWSIINYMSNMPDDPKPYWAHTSSNKIIRDLVRESPDGLKSELYDLLKDRPVTKKIEENIVFDDLFKDDGTLYSFLLFAGYLTAFDRRRVGAEDYRKFLIPNLEVKHALKNTVMQWITGGYESRKLKIMLDALIQGDIKTFETALGDFILETLSYFDTAGKNVEKVYQAFLLGLLANLSHSYEINSEKESGFGRYDISVVPKDKSKKAIVLELKTVKENESKDAALAGALAQIEEKKYESAILKTGVKKIRKIAVVFDGKRVWCKMAGVSGH